VQRIYHTWNKWECYPAGFYNNKPPGGMTREECEREYVQLLTDEQQFSHALERVIKEWKHSCEHYLSNENMNRIAWLGQASLCISKGIPSDFRGGFNQLSEEQQTKANGLALDYLNKWLSKYSEGPLTWEQAQSKTEANLY
jgi:hypothetical protein